MEIYLKDVILALSSGARKLNACKNTSHTVLYHTMKHHFYILFPELKQKLARAEEREQAFKRKAECFDSLMEVSALKRPHREGSCEPAVQNDSSDDQARSSPKISSEPVRGKAERLLNTVDLIRTRSQRDKSKRISTTSPVGENGNKVEEDENSSDTIPLEMEGDTKVKEEK